MNRRRWLLLTILLLLLELVFKSSGISWLADLDLLVIMITVLVPRDASILGLSLFIISSIIVEIFAYKVIGVTSLTWFLAVLVVKILGSFITLLNLSRKNILALIMIYVIFFFLKYAGNYWLNGVTELRWASLFSNLIILLCLQLLSGRLFSKKYVL